MDGPSAELLARMPLAEAVFLLWRHVADEARLQRIFEDHRGRSYEKQITFPTMVQLIADALLAFGGSGHQSFSRASEAGALEASIRAAYGKLSRMPIPLSLGLFSELTDRLRDLFPESGRRLPPSSLQAFAVITLDGKAIKRVAKRLKPLRGLSGGVLGGRALVAMEYETGTALALHAHPDGDANDVRFVPDLLPAIRNRIDGPRLWLADRQFCDLVQMEYFTEAHDHFLVRYNAKLSFHRDASQPVRRGIDRQGRRYEEEWGWGGRNGHPKRRFMRRIRLIRPGEDDVLLATDLLSWQDYPAEELLDLYLERWGIERMFQKVTEVFGLEHLIGGTPESTIFQFVFCLLLYNQIQLVRAYVAAHQRRDFETISLEQLFIDVQRELIAWTIVIPVDVTIGYLAPTTARRVRQRLHQLLGNQWSTRWIKARNKKRRSHQNNPYTRTHSSVYRILQDQPS